MIRAMLDRLPDGARELGGDLAHEAEKAMVVSNTGRNLVQQQALYRKMEELRVELGGPNPQPVERLLVERVVLCWFHAYYADYQYASADNVTRKHGEYLQRQQDRSQRRYLAAIKSLATVRKLALPVVRACSRSGGRLN
jgi:hypothetical protein